MPYMIPTLASWFINVKWGLENLWILKGIAVSLFRPEREKIEDFDDVTRLASMESHPLCDSVVIIASKQPRSS